MMEILLDRYFMVERLRSVSKALSARLPGNRNVYKQFINISAGILLRLLELGMVRNIATHAECDASPITVP